MAENFYAHCMGAENDLCVPAIPANAIKAIPGLVYESIGEDGVGPSIMLDAEQLQVCDYTTFERVTEGQRDFITSLLNESPVRTDEMQFLSLRSMFGFVWPEPSSAEDIIRVAKFELTLNEILKSAAGAYSPELVKPDAKLPYWGRLAFLRVMAALPEEQVTAYDLGKVAIVLTKRPAFNATTFSLENGEAVIGLNYALDPILKNLNRHLLHFRHTEHMAGPARMARAWNALYPTVLYFWANGPADKLLRNCLFFDEKSIRQAQWLTVAQTDFILRHELGHVVFDHPKRFRELKNAGGDVTPTRHEFEYAADAFAFGLMRAKALNDARYFVNPKRNKQEGETEEDGVNALTEHLHDHEAVSLLFLYMAFIDDAGRLLRSRLVDGPKFRENLDTHPKARGRLKRLQIMALGDRPLTTDLLDYARSFLDNVLAYVEQLPLDQLLDPQPPPK